MLLTFLPCQCAQIILALWIFFSSMNETTSLISSGLRSECQGQIYQVLDGKQKQQQLPIISKGIYRMPFHITFYLKAYGVQERHCSSLKCNCSYTPLYMALCIFQEASLVSPICIFKDVYLSLPTSVSILPSCLTLILLFPFSAFPIHIICSVSQLS